jgi:hypothetical protein
MLSDHFSAWRRLPLAASFGVAVASGLATSKAEAQIEVARCLSHDFGTGQDPGLCRE